MRESGLITGILMISFTAKALQVKGFSLNLKRGKIKLPAWMIKEEIRLF
jgi:hypothetical protein